ncbi:YybH family protein [Pseudonocardia sp. TRM90224]|uniref:YybH family protein n=1 Tax=Pseudonocardia sp. TRM90224 TaxID=2812678 RepID=UPI001E33FE56|nr:nuclear transport factor 2 family protein [Pseudonocardia sp. TRM90224]
MTTTEAGVMELLEGRVDACRAKDLDRLMSYYSPGIVYFDVVPPLQFAGTDAVRRNFRRWFNEYEGPILLQTHELNIAAGDDVAFASMLHVDDGRRNNGIEGEVWIRSTVCCRRIDGKWLVTHEHVSIPAGWVVPETDAPTG